VRARGVTVRVVRELADGRVVVALEEPGRAPRRRVLTRAVWAQLARQPAAERDALVRHLIEAAPTEDEV